MTVSMSVANPSSNPEVLKDGQKVIRKHGQKTYLPTERFSCQSSGMMIVFANSKGGVGKSTLAVHLAVWLFDQGYKTALLDADKQRSSSVWISEAEPKITVSMLTAFQSSGAGRPNLVALGC